MRAATLALPVIALLSSGCIPVTYYDISSINGTVRDIQTGAPIDGAVITELPQLLSKVTARATTDKAGQFAIAPISHIEWAPLGSDVLNHPPKILISASGYADKIFDLFAIGQQTKLDLRLQHN